MKSPPKIGMVGEVQFVVEEKHAIEFATNGMPAVLSTPNLIGIIERTARQSLMPFLDADERTVGVEIELRHLVPSPLGTRVTVMTRVIQVEGKQIQFQVEARDEHEIIARGIHKRAIIRTGSFAHRLKAKLAKTA